jgi:glucokinase
VIVEGKSIDGNNSFGSECGHIVIDCRENARTCVWGGGRGELEAYASASAVVRFAQEELENGCESSVRARVNNGEQLSPLMLCEEAEKGDDFSMRIILETARILGVGVVSLVHVVDPGIVVLGGAMNFGGNKTKTGRRFLNRVREEFRSRAYPVVRDTTVIDYATLGSDAGYIGAAGIARADYQAETSDH